MSDLEKPSAYRERRRKARYDHKCSDCCGIIRKGDFYMYVSGIWDNQPQAYRQCWPCLSFRNKLKRLNAGDRYYEGEALGGLYYNIPREEWPTHAIRVIAKARGEA